MYCMNLNTAAFFASSVEKEIRSAPPAGSCFVRPSKPGTCATLRSKVAFSLKVLIFMIVVQIMAMSPALKFAVCSVSVATGA